MAQAGTFYGINPGLAEFACDLRTLPGMSRESVQGDLQGFLSMAMKDDPTLDAELIFEKWLPATEIGADDAAVTVLRDAATAILGAELPIGAFPGATDATYFQLGSGIPTVAAFGPGYLSRAHQPNESVPVGQPPPGGRNLCFDRNSISRGLRMTLEAYWKPAANLIKTFSRRPHDPLRGRI